MAVTNADPTIRPGIGNVRTVSQWTLNRLTAQMTKNFQVSCGMIIDIGVKLN